jgi:hypothetical protein
MSDSNKKRRVSQHGRGLPGGRSRVANYFEGTDGMDEDEIRRMNLERLRELAQEMGFDSLFDVAIAEAQSSPREKELFMGSGHLSDLLESLRGPIKRRRDAGHQDTSLFESEICSMSRDIYVREWRHLISDNVLRRGTLTDDSPPDFAALYPRFKSHAPQLFDLLDALLPEPDKENSDESLVIDLTKDDTSSNSASRKKKQARIVVAVSTLGYQANSHNDAFQFWMGKVLHGHKFSKRLLNFMNQLGISASFKTITKYAKAQTKTDSTLHEVQTNQTTPTEKSSECPIMATQEPQTVDAPSHRLYAPIPFARPTEMPATTATIPHAEYERASLAPTSNTFNIPVVANLSENWGDEQGRLRFGFPSGFFTSHE